MSDLLKNSLIFTLILLFLRKKLNIGLVMLIAASVLFLLYRMPLISIWKTCKGAAINNVTIKLILALTFIRVFEMILREHAVLKQMVGAVKAIFKNRKIVIVSMPFMIGLIPSVGGAYFSAPMVAETTSDTRMSPEEKGFINYWFRHPWEYILPLYPGILLASAVSKIELHNLITKDDLGCQIANLWWTWNTARQPPFQPADTRFQNTTLLHSTKLLQQILQGNCQEITLTTRADCFGQTLKTLLLSKFLNSTSYALFQYIIENNGTANTQRLNALVDEETRASIEKTQQQKDINSVNIDQYIKIFKECECIICFSYTIRYRFLNCKHEICCDSCFQRLENKTCPMCRAPIVKCEELSAKDIELLNEERKNKYFQIASF